MSRIISSYKVNYNPLKNAFPYQIEAVETIKNMDYCAVFHEQGLGKTKIAIDLLLYWLRNRDIDTVIIVTKKQLVKNWIEEFGVHTHIKPKVLSNNKAENFYVFNSPAKVIITNYETISTDKERMKLFLKSRDVGVIIDESTKIKNPESKLTKDFFELSSLFKIKTIMTGTPVANRPYDIWAQIFFLDEGKSLGGDFKSFKKNTDLRNDFIDNVEKRRKFETTVSEIFEKISDFSIRETKSSCGIQLPEKEYVTIYSEFENQQEKMYKQIIHEFEVEVVRDGELEQDDDSIALKRLLRLLQVTSNPRLINENYDVKSAKEEKLEIILDEIIEKEEKCIVWSSYIENVEYFCSKFKNLNPVKIHGSLSISERNMAVDKFKKDNTCKVMFATPQAAKEGLTLTVSNNVIFYDRGFNLDDYLQAQDRIHRISQKKKCYVYNLIVKNSIDEWVEVLLQAKQHAAFLAQGDIKEEDYIKNADYSYGEIVRYILNAEEDI